MTAETPAPELLRIDDLGSREHYLTRVLQTRRGPIETRLYRAEQLTRTGAILVGGVGGGFDTPARSLYPRLGEQLAQRGVHALRVRFRHPTRIQEAIYDILAAESFLASQGANNLAIIGHSFGGAVAIAAGALSSDVKTIITLASQTAWATEFAPDLGRRSLLLIHGTRDAVLPPSCSISLHELSSGPSELRLIEGAGHSLDEASEEILQLILHWISDKLLLEEIRPRERRG